MFRWCDVTFIDNCNIDNFYWEYLWIARIYGHFSWNTKICYCAGHCVNKDWVKEISYDKKEVFSLYFIVIM